MSHTAGVFPAEQNGGWHVPAEKKPSVAVLQHPFPVSISTEWYGRASESFPQSQLGHSTSRTGETTCLKQKGCWITDMGSNRRQGSIRTPVTDGSRGKSLQPLKRDQSGQGVAIDQTLLQPSFPSCSDIYKKTTLLCRVNEI